MNFIIDQAWGSSGKGKMSCFLADQFESKQISSSNFPNAGHTFESEGRKKFIAKALPTSAILYTESERDIELFISPGSGFSWEQLRKEWEECGKPRVYIHERASIVTDEHKSRESAGSDSTKHIASTMQGTAAALTDKILRRRDVKLARSDYDLAWAESRVQVLPAEKFRFLVYQKIRAGSTWLHEGSQGYALSIDHGSHYPECTSRNCTLQSYMDHMAVPPQMVGDVYLNLRTFPIRVGNVVEEGIQKGYSGDFYSDCTELDWDSVARNSGMPPEEQAALCERERTTVTKRIRRVSTFSWYGLIDAVRTNGATKICVNFVQYLNWNDAGLRGEQKAFEKLSKESREFIAKVEKTAGIPVVLIGTGARHDQIISLL